MMSDERHELFSMLMEDHCHRLLNEKAGQPGICAAIQGLMSADVMRRSTELAVDVAGKVLNQGKKDAGVTEERTYKDFLLIVTFYITARFPVISRSFPGGYLAWLTEAFQRADRLPGCPALAHWIFVMDGATVGTHLTITEKDKNQYILYAWDLFNPSEMRSLYGSDIRSSEVIQQWTPRV